MIVLAVGPALVFYSVFLIFPMIYSFYMSVHDWPGASMVKAPEYVGLGNYERAFFADSLFLRAVVGTVYYAVLYIPTHLIIAVLLAVMINSLPRQRGAYRILYFLPVLTPAVASGLIWKYIYQPRFGLINTVLTLISDALHLALPLPAWLDDPYLAMPSIVVQSIWQSVGYSIVIILAGLQSIPEALYEAARVDGAGPFQTFWQITVPLLRPTVIFLLVVGVIGSLQVFTPMYVMTKGGPVDATLTITYHLYNQAFESFRFGYASSLAVILFLLIFVLTVLQLRFIRVGWEY